MTDAFDDFVDDEETEQPDPPQKSPAEVRLDKEKAKLRKQVEELSAKLAEREQADRQKNVAETFQAVGLNPKWSTFYQGEETTPEAVKAWALANDFIPPSEDNEEPAPVPQQTTGFTPTVLNESQPLGMKTYDVDEFTALLREDPKKAEAVYKAGRLKQEEPEWTYSSRFYGRDT